jgi:hypothetical protein
MSCLAPHLPYQLLCTCPHRPDLLPSPRRATSPDINVFKATATWLRNSPGQGTPDGYSPRSPMQHSPFSLGSPAAGSSMAESPPAGSPGRMLMERHYAGSPLQMLRSPWSGGVEFSDSFTSQAAPGGWGGVVEQAGRAAGRSRPQPVPHSQPD